MRKWEQHKCWEHCVGNHGETVQNTRLFRRYEGEIGEGVSVGNIKELWGEEWTVVRYNIQLEITTVIEDDLKSKCNSLLLVGDVAQMLTSGMFRHLRYVRHFQQVVVVSVKHCKLTSPTRSMATRSYRLIKETQNSHY